jgi:hypothetical protein
MWPIAWCACVVFVSGYIYLYLLSKKKKTKKTKKSKKKKKKQEIARGREEEKNIKK